MKQSTRNQKIEHKIAQLERQFKNIEDFCSEDSKTAVNLGKGIINDIRKIIKNEPDAYYFSKNNKYMFCISGITLKVDASDNIRLYPSISSMLTEIAEARNTHPEVLIPEIIRIEIDNEANLLVNKKIYEFNGNGSLIDSIIES